MKFKTEDYQEWFIYCSEYKMLFLDHFSTMAELAELRQARASGKALEVGWPPFEHTRLYFYSCCCCCCCCCT